MDMTHPGILEGTGSRESPFMVMETSYSNSGRIQRETVERMYGSGTYPNVYTPDKGGVVAAMAGASLYGEAKTGRLIGRAYHQSPRGLPGNRDLCETIFFLDEIETKVWFDLSNVTKFETSPAAKKWKEAIREDMDKHPERTQRLQEEMLRLMGLPPKPKAKGCLVVLVLLVVAMVGIISAFV